MEEHDEYFWGDLLKKCIISFCAVFVFSAVFCIMYTMPNDREYVVVRAIAFGTFLHISYLIAGIAFINPLFVVGTWILQHNSMLGYRRLNDNQDNELVWISTGTQAISIICSQIVGVICGCLITIPLLGFSFPIAPEFPAFFYWIGFLGEMFGMFV